MVLNLMDTINKWADDLKNLFIDHSRDPLFMLLIVVVGLVFFMIAFKALNKD